MLVAKWCYIFSYKAYFTSAGSGTSPGTHQTDRSEVGKRRGSLELSRPVPPVWELIVAELHSPVHTDHLCLKTTLRARTQHRYSPILDRLSPHRRGHRLATLTPARSSLVHHLTRGRTDLHFLNFQTNHRRRDSIHRTLRQHVTVLRTRPSILRKDMRASQPIKSLL